MILETQFRKVIEVFQEKGMPIILDFNGSWIFANMTLLLYPTKTPVIKRLFYFERVSGMLSYRMHTGYLVNISIEEMITFLYKFFPKGNKISKEQIILEINESLISFPINVKNN